MHIVEKDFRRVVVDHRIDGFDVHAVFFGLAHIDQKDRHPIRAPFAFFLRRRSREQQHDIGMAGAADPNLLTIDHITVAGPLSLGSELGCVGPGGGLGDAKSL